MKFIEALTEMRKGKKIRHHSFKQEEYLEGCYALLPTIIDDDGKEISGNPNDWSPEEKQSRMSIVKMNGDRQADSMMGKLNYVAKIKRHLKKILSEEDYKKYNNIYTEMEIGEIFDENIFKYPQINLYLLMQDDWEVIE